MSRREYKVITRRLLRGRHSSAREGKFVGSRAPYGYRKVKLIKQKGYTLEIIEEDARIVRLIFNMFIKELKRPQEICDYLNSLSIKAPKNDEWTVSGVREILRNPIYCGYIQYNERVTTKQIKDGKIVLERHTNKGELKELIYVKGLHPAIISEEIFKQAADLRKSRDVSPLSRNNDLTNPLAGIVYCRLCGKRLGKSKSRGKNRIYCRSRNCNNVSIFLDEIEEKILLFLESWLEDKQLNKPEVSNNVLKLKEDLLTSKQLDLDAFKKKQERIFDLFEDGTYDKETFVVRNEKIISSISKLEEDISILQSELEKIKKIEYEKNNFIPTVKSVLKQYRKTTNTELKNKLLKTVINKVYYLKTEERSSFFELWVLPKLPKN